MGSGLVVVAASGLAREVLATDGFLDTFDDVIIVDDAAKKWGTELAGHVIVGGLDQIAAYPRYSIIVCAGKGAVRRDIVARLAELGVGDDRYATCVNLRAEIAKDCPVGAGSIVMAGVVMTADVRVGRHVVLMPQVTLTHDDVVDDYATLCAGVTLGGSVRIGEAAYLGMNGSVRENLTVGADSMLGMASALVHDLPDGETWVGVPARAHQLRGADT